MRVLIGCERSGIVRDAFRNLGHDAYSCDIVECERDDTYHIQDDVLNVINRGWDLGIFHPDCTYLCSSGLHWNKRRPERAKKTEESLDFVKNIMGLANEHCEGWALENSVGCISTRIRKYDQKIQPWQFGEDASKGTCFWYGGKTSPQNLRATSIIPPRGWELVIFADELWKCDMCGEPWCEIHQEHYSECSCIGPTEDGVIYKKIEGYLFGRRGDWLHPVWGNQTPSGQNKLGPSEDRWLDRSRTYEGIAKAMAEQWGKHGTT